MRAKCITRLGNNLKEVRRNRIDIIASMSKTITIWLLSVILLVILPALSCSSGSTTHAAAAPSETTGQAVTVPATATAPTTQSPQQSQPIPSKPAMLTYINRDKGYSVDYPEGWTVEMSDKGVLSVRPPNQRGGIFVGNRSRSTRAEIMAAFSNLLIETKESNKTCGINEDTEPWDYSMWWDEIVTDNNMQITMHWEIYLRLYGNYGYLIIFNGEKAEYDSFPFKEVLASFKPLDQ